jgi:hypothetical protein
VKRRLLALSAGLVAAVALAEVLLGGPLRPPVVSERDAAWQARTTELHTLLYMPDEELGYVPRPGAALEMDYGPAAHNRQGMREPTEIVRDHERPRLAVLGDSLVWGELLAEGDSLPSQLEARLGGVEVLNFGVSGYDTVQEAAWYRRAVRPLEPDAVVLVFCLNDLLTMSGPLQIHGGTERAKAYEQERSWLDGLQPFRNETVSQRWLEARSGSGSQVWAALEHAWSWHRLFTLPGGYVDEPLLSLRDPARVQAFREALSRLGGDLAQDGVRAQLLISPGLYWWHRYPWEPLHELVREAGAEAGFEVLDPLPDLRHRSPRGWRFEGDNLHYTPLGMASLADWLAPRVSLPGPPSEEPGASAPPAP